MASARKLISIITPCFNEEQNVEACCRALRQTMETSLPEYDYEHILADNASSDGTVSILRKMAAQDMCLKIIVNSRDVGPFRNTFNALKSTSGDAVVVLFATDLQDPPEVIVDFVRAWEQGFPIVYGVRSKREEAWWLRNVRKAYYRLVRRMANIDIPVDASEFQLIDRSVVDSVSGVDDYYPYIRGLIAQTGLKAKGIPYTWRRRQKGNSKNNLFDLVDQGLNGLISTSVAPLRIAIFVGTATAILSLVYAVGSLIINLVTQDLSPPGIATLVVALFFFGGIQLLAIGLLGEYVLAIHQQLRRGPSLFEVERINFDEASSSHDSPAPRQHKPR